MSENSNSAVIEPPQTNSQIVEALLGSGEYIVPDAPVQETPSGDPATSSPPPSDAPPADSSAPVQPEPQIQGDQPPAPTQIKLLALGGSDVDLSTAEGREKVARLDEQARHWQSQAQKLEAQLTRQAQPRDESGKFTAQPAPTPPAQPQNITVEMVETAKNLAIEENTVARFVEYQEIFNAFNKQQLENQLASRLPPAEAVERLRESVISPDERRTAEFVRDTFESDVPVEAIVHVHREIMKDLTQAITNGATWPDGSPVSWDTVNTGRLNRTIHNKAVEYHKAELAKNQTQVSSNGAETIAAKGDVSPGTPLKTPDPVPPVRPTATVRPNNSVQTAQRPNPQNQPKISNMEIANLVLAGKPVAVAR